jgi:transposase
MFVLGDRAYDGNPVRKAAFARLKQFRSLATRFDKTARSYAAQVAIACIVVWLKL